MRTMKKNWLLAAAVSAALSGYSGLSLASSHGGDAVAHSATPGAPAILELTTALDSIANVDGAPVSKVKLWVIDANGHITSNDMDHTVTLTSSDSQVIADAEMNFPAGASYAEFTIGKTGDIAPQGNGDTTLTASFATAGSTDVATAIGLPMSVVGDFLQASNLMQGPVVAGTPVDAFNITNAAGTPLAGQPLTIIHYDIGSSKPPAEVIGGLPDGFTPDTPGLDGGKGSFPMADDNGNVNVTFFTASANPTTTGEYYVIKDPTGQFADIRVDNTGSDNKPDIIPAAASDVLFIDDGMVLDTIPAMPTGSGYAATLPKLTAVDAFGNMITPFDALGTLGTANVTVTSPAGGTLANGIVSYDNTLTTDTLTLDFNSPAGASADLKVVAEGSDPVMSKTCIALTMKGSLNGVTGALIPADAKFTGGVTTEYTNIPQENLVVDAHDKVSMKFTVTPDANADGNFGMIALYRPPVPNSPTFAAYFLAGTNGDGIGGANLWNFDTSTVPAYNNAPVSGPNTSNLLTNFEFGFGLMGDWFFAPGYTSGDAYVTCAAYIAVK